MDQKDVQPTAKFVTMSIYETNVSLNNLTYAPKKSNTHHTQQLLSHARRETKDSRLHPRASRHDLSKDRRSLWDLAGHSIKHQPHSLSQGTLREDDLSVDES